MSTIIEKGILGMENRKGLDHDTSPIFNVLIFTERETLRELLPTKYQDVMLTLVDMQRSLYEQQQAELAKYQAEIQTKYLLERENKIRRPADQYKGKRPDGNSGDGTATVPVNIDTGHTDDTITSIP